MMMLQQFDAMNEASIQSANDEAKILLFIVTGLKRFNWSITGISRILILFTFSYFIAYYIYISDFIQIIFTLIFPSVVCSFYSCIRSVTYNFSNFYFYCSKFYKFVVRLFEKQKRGAVFPYSFYMSIYNF